MEAVSAWMFKIPGIHLTKAESMCSPYLVTWPSESYFWICLFFFSYFLSTYVTTTTNCGKQQLRCSEGSALTWPLFSLPLHFSKSTHNRCVSMSSYCTCSYILTAFSNCRAAPLWPIIPAPTSAVIFAAAAHSMSVLSLAATITEPISSSSCLRRVCRHCLLSLWSDSLLAWCLEQLSNLINSIIRPLLLPGCFTPRGRVHWRVEA